MLLFFFVAIGMVPAPQSQIEETQVIMEGGEELEETKRYAHVYIGIKDGEVVAQVGYDIIVPVDQLTEALKEYRKDYPYKDIVVLRIDKDTSMGVVRNIIEPNILEAGVQKVIYFLEDEA